MVSKKIGGRLTSLRMNAMSIHPYAFGVLSVFLATIAMILIGPPQEKHLVFSALFLAVMITAWHGGVFPAVSSALSGGILYWVLLASPSIPNQTGWNIFIDLSMYSVPCMGVAIIGGRLLEALERLRRVEKGLQHQREQFEFALEQISDGVILTDDLGRICHMNRTSQEITGTSIDEARGRPLNEVTGVVDEETGLPVTVSVEHHASEGPDSPVFKRSLSIVQKGTEYPVERFVRDPRIGRAESFSNVFVIRNVSGRDRLESTQGGINGNLEQQLDSTIQELRASETKFRLLVEGTVDYAIFMLDKKGRIVSWNPGAQRIKQYSSDEIVGKHFSCFYPPEEIQAGKPERELEIAIAEGKYEEEGWRLRKDGTQFWANVIITALKNPEGELQGFSKITRDLTDRMLSEATKNRLIQEETARRVAEEHLHELWQQKERWLVTLRSIGDGVIVTDEEGRIVLLNQVAESLTGWETDVAVGRNIQEVFQIVNEQSRKTVDNPAVRALGDGQVASLADQTLLIAKHGTEYAIADSAAPIRNEYGEIVGAVLVVRDVTESKLLEEQYRQSQKMEAVGRLAGGIAHDFNNLVTVILGCCEILESVPETTEASLSYISDIRTSGERAAALTQRLLAFSRKQVLCPRVLDLNEVLKDTGILLERLLGKGVSLTITPDPDLEAIFVDPIQLEQVILNLAINARDAMPNGGTLSFETANQFVEKHFVTPECEVPPGHYVILKVADTGIGMTPETKARIFEPFFTTKPSTKGTGLGLSTVFGIVKQSEGYISVLSEVNQGTEFTIYFPRAGGIQS